MSKGEAKRFPLFAKRIDIWQYGEPSDIIDSLADMAELADALDLGSSGESRAGSSPVIRIKIERLMAMPLTFLFLYGRRPWNLVQGLRFAPVGAEQTSTGRFAPYYPHEALRSA